jgi:hypothetical protein
MKERGERREERGESREEGGERRLVGAEWVRPAGRVGRAAAWLRFVLVAGSELRERHVA